MTAQIKVRRTEAEMLALLRARHAKPGNGGAGEYAYMAHVRNAAGFDANRTFDAITVSLWPSRGLEIAAYEVKCSRTDWLRELKNPAKAEDAARVCDRFWMVTADDSIILDGELPETWGLMVARGPKLVCVKQAPLLPEANVKRPVGRSFLVGLLRSAGAVPELEPKQIRDARDEAYRKGVEEAKASLEAERAISVALRHKIATFEREAGIRLGGGWQSHDPADVGRAVRSILEGEKRAEEAQRRIKQVQEQLRRAADELDQFAEKVEAGGADG